jgi:hypothetical protein
MSNKYALLIIAANGMVALHNPSASSPDWASPMTREEAEAARDELAAQNDRLKLGTRYLLVEVPTPQLYLVGLITREDIETKLHTEVQVNWDGNGFFALPMGVLCESDDGEMFTVASIDPRLTCAVFKSHGVVVS